MRGEFQHNLDAKGRLIFPAKLREELGDDFVVSKGLDNCLFVFSRENWDEFERKIGELPLAQSRKMQRFFCAPAVECVPDGQGRVLLPQPLREFAGISRDVTILGMQGRAEIWDTERWREYNRMLTAEGIADVMEELGF